MNQYGKHAQQTWQMIAPTEYAKIVDPEAWFEELGRQAQERVGELTYQIAGPDSPDETYLGKVGRINAAKMQAEEIIRAEMLTPDEAVVQEEPDEDEDSPVAEMLKHQQEMMRFQRQLDEEEELRKQQENDRLNSQ